MKGPLDWVRVVVAGLGMVLALLVARQAKSRATDRTLPVGAISWPGLISYLILLVVGIDGLLGRIGKPLALWLPMTVVAFGLGFLSVYRTMHLPTLDRLRGWRHRRGTLAPRR